MITDQQCEQILNKSNYKYKPEEIIKIKKFLYLLGGIEYLINKKTENGDSSNIHTSKHRRSKD